MQSTLDTFCTLTIATVMAGLSITAFSRIDAGNPTKGWASGTYQRGFENRFEQSIPAQEGSVALWAAAKWALFGETAAGAVAGREGWLFTAEEFTEPSETRDLATELSRVVEALSENGTALVPVIVPDKARMRSDRLPRGRSEGFDTRYQRALEAIEDTGLPVIDLRPALSFEKSFMRTDTHWSPEGARRAAEAVADVVEGFELPHTDVQTVATGSVGFDGDLLSFVATGPFRSIVGPAPESIDTFETIVEASAGLFDDAAIPIALVGTSYSAKPEFHFAGFLKQAARADVLNASYVGQGPFAPMDTFLKDRATLSTLPSLVVWEIPERFLTSRSLLP
ncbi:alginate O-acetyltransferase AlgX-related protein [Shimia sp.]|uniref:alginate O-acetyltransferase AlgX-related protein n=1 Tax=Shimia sp. TaxID=1954381 RepID=UPI003B8DECBC